MESLNSLPDEIISDIFLRLHVRCLIRCTAVCKPWKTVIKSSGFIYTHLNYTIEDGSRLFFFFFGFPRYPQAFGSRLIPFEDGSRLLLHHGRLKPQYDKKLYGQERFALHYDNRGFGDYCELDFQIDRMHMVKTYNSPFSVVGVCNGVICLADFEMCNYFLWNPAIRKVVQLPKPTVTLISPRLGFGFGFDALTNDYKVVSVTPRLDLYEHEDEKEVLIPTLAEVYSLATGSWRSVGDISCCNLLTDVDNIFFNGAIHWALKRWDDRRTFILTFDVGSDTFGEISMPESIIPDQLLSWKVSLTGDGKSLALFTTSKENHNKLDLSQVESDYFLDIWVMNEYGVQESWTRMMRLDKQTGIPRPLCFRQSSQEVFLLKRIGFFTNESLLVSLDLVSQKVNTQES